MWIAWLITMGTKLANARKLIYPIRKQDNVQTIFKSKVFVNSFKSFKIDKFTEEFCQTAPK